MLLITERKKAIEKLPQRKKIFVIYNWKIAKKIGRGGRRFLHN